tara:strand:- start:70 stop:981 length:912 start_codon:yes stop_codon:yes gene_type:complete
MKKEFNISVDFNNTRLDRWFRKNIFLIPQSLLEKNIRKGFIKVNNFKKKSSYKVKTGDKIFINIKNLSPPKKQNLKLKYIPTKKTLSTTSDLFIENNENFVVINKPSGISVQSGTKSKKNIIDILAHTREFEGYKPYTVHRIDKETTGILIVAKTRSYAQLFTSLFRIRKIHKTYLGIVCGEFPKKKGTLIDDLITYEGDKKIVSKAITHYTIIDSNNNYSLIKLNPETGRKHQLRKQLLIFGCPILGDNKYRVNFNNKKKENELMLHAYKINFSIAGLKFNFTANPPENFLNMLKKKFLRIF